MLLGLIHFSYFRTMSKHFWLDALAKALLALVYPIGALILFCLLLKDISSLQGQPVRPRPEGVVRAAHDLVAILIPYWLTTLTGVANESLDIDIEAACRGRDVPLIAPPPFFLEQFAKGSAPPPDNSAASTATSATKVPGLAPGGANADQQDLLGLKEPKVHGGNASSEESTNENDPDFRAKVEKVQLNTGLQVFDNFFNSTTPSLFPAEPSNQRPPKTDDPQQ
jgi:hypothetical protein